MVRCCVQAGISHPFGEAVWVSDKQELESTCLARGSVPREIPAVWEQLCSHTHTAPAGPACPSSICSFRNCCHLGFSFRDYTKYSESAAFAMIYFSN